jgi:hypothetical protein
MRELERPPAELLARVMGDVRAHRRPPTVGWLVGAQTALLAALLVASAPATLPTELAATVETVRDWSASLAQATLEFSADMDRLLGLDFEKGEI